MKSKKAAEILARSYDGGHICMENAETAVEVAEQEAEERMREELFQWHDPKGELPENDREVLCIIDSLASTFMVLRHNDLGWWMHPPHYYGWCSCCFNVLGWRYIHESDSKKGGEK